MIPNSNDPVGTVPDGKSSQLRVTLAAIERDLARIPREIADDNAANATDGLRTSVADLVRQLALGPEPDYRQCPVCNHTVMFAATTCGHCWTKLTPPTASVGGGV